MFAVIFMVGATLTGVVIIIQGLWALISGTPANLYFYGTADTYMWYEAIGYGFFHLALAAGCYVFTKNKE